MRDVGSGCVLAVIAFVYFLGARGLPVGNGEPGPRLFPFLLAGALLLLATSIVARGWRGNQESEQPLARPAGLIVLTALYTVAFTFAGFLASTMVYSAGVVLLLGERGWRAAVIPLVTTAFIYVTFVLGLGVVLP